MSIQSISKAFVYALVTEEFGHHVVGERMGVNNTGLAFNSVVSLELNDGHPMNPMVNAGAIATTGRSLARPATRDGPDRDDMIMHIGPAPRRPTLGGLARSPASDYPGMTLIVHAVPAPPKYLR